MLVINVEGTRIVNTTPHSITFGIEKEGGAIGEVIPVEVPPCGILINAKAVEKTVKTEGGVEYVSTVFEGTPEGEKLITEIEEFLSDPDEESEAVIVGSIIAAQAYPGRVVGMVPLPGYERVAPQEKRMDPHKFTIFTK